MLTLLEPALIIGLGLVIAGIIVSILMAILGANELVF
jgi:general secretion pathway protein F